MRKFILITKTGEEEVKCENIRSGDVFMIKTLDCTDHLYDQDIIFLAHGNAVEENGVWEVPNVERV